MAGERERCSLLFSGVPATQVIFFIPFWGARLDGAVFHPDSPSNTSPPLSVPPFLLWDVSSLPCSVLTDWVQILEVGRWLKMGRGLREIRLTFFCLEICLMKPIDTYTGSMGTLINNLFHLVLQNA